MPTLPDQHSADCPHRVACGACGLLREPYPVQLDRKRRWLADELDRHLRFAPRQLLPTLPSPLVVGYRSRAKLTISSGRDRPAELGYFRRRSREVVDAPDCVVLVPELLATSRQLRALLNDRALRFPFELRHVDLRCGSDPTRQHLTLVVRAERPPRLPVEAIAAACPQVVGIGLNLNPGSGPQVVKGPIQPLAGAREVTVDCAGLSLRVSAGSFFQVNLGLLPMIHERMAAFLGEGELLLDLYAGVGTHGLALRDRFRRVLCVEGVRGAAADARASLTAAGVTNVEVLASPLHRAVKRLATEHPDAVILNPSTAGAEPAALAAVLASSARALAYLSCDPATLARDLGVLVNGGFELVTAQAVDMMPQTRQVEALALLRR